MGSKKLLSFLILLTLSTMVTGQNTWQTKAAFTGGQRDGAAVFGIGNFGYLVGGVDASSITHNDTWRYDPSNNTWTQLAALSGQPRHNPVACVIADNGYVGTGLSGATYYNDWWEYQVTLNTWVQRASFPGQARYIAVATSTLGKAYVGLGKPASYYADWYEYDAGTDTWATKTSFPGAARGNGIALTVGNYAYVGLGASASSAYADLYRYDPSNDSWLVRSDYPGVLGIYAPGTFTIGTHLFVCGGYDYAALHDDGFDYNVNGDSWSSIASFSNVSPARYFRGGFAVAGKGYLVGGSTVIASVSGFRSDLIEYTSNFTGITENEKDANFFSVAYSNISHELVISSADKKEGSSVIIYDAAGRLISNSALNSAIVTHITVSLPSGIYLYAILNKSNSLCTGKFLVAEN